ncbi:hypothetical protein FH972_026186 [Carpinus fangiana]|uniref:Uncharacterized protein n=1 Tax=Carpinus fangiana TaxID=176857 RepID=A0A5N6L384_9ROSI|nr:hypothetical protein FH972_026186 [Carpinus fangiana]
MAAANQGTAKYMETAIPTTASFPPKQHCKYTDAQATSLEEQCLLVRPSSGERGGGVANG